MFVDIHGRRVTCSIAIFVWDADAKWLTEASLLLPVPFLGMEDVKKNLTSSSV